MGNKLLAGDVLTHLRAMPTSSCAAALSDPPYGLQFLGLAWDKVLPPADVWVELARVLRPGANALIFGGTRTFHRLAVALEDAGFDVVDVLMWLHSQGLPKSKSLLKPAWEPIIQVRNKGAIIPLNIDGCRIGTGLGGERKGEASANKRYTERGTTNFAMKPGPRGGDARGRWPANVIADTEAAAAIDRASGIRKSGAMRTGTIRARADSYSGNWGGAATKTDIPKSEGGASRFFYCPKVKGDDRVHPTQKPVALTEWLAKLLYVPDGRLLIPYAGVGSEMVGAISAGWQDTIGIELNSEYVALADKRIAEGE